MAFQTPNTTWTSAQGVTNADLNRIEGNEAQLAIYTGGWGSVTGSGTVFAVTMDPAPTAYVAGLKITVLWNTTNSANPTINVNGLGAKSILKGNGGSIIAGFLKPSSVYTLAYNGTAFILQGEGGEYGTATAAQVLNGYNIGTEAGLVNGAMIDRSRTVLGAGYATALSVKADTSGNLVMEPPTGYYTAGLNASGFGSLLANDPDFVANNLPNDKNIFGLQGSMPRQSAYTAPASVAWDGTSLYVRIPQGAYQTTGGSGYPEIQLSAAQARADGNISAGNIRNGTWIYGVMGTLVPDTSGVIGVDYYSYPGAGVGGTFNIVTIPTCKYFVFGDYPAGSGVSQIYTYATAGSPVLYFQCVDAGGVVVNLITILNTGFTVRIKAIYFNAAARTIKISTEDFGGATATISLPGGFNVNGAVTLRWQSVSSGTSSPYNGCTLAGNVLYA